MNYGNGNQKPVGTWDYFGAYAPLRGIEFYSNWKAFTLGVFQWIPARRGTKRGKVIRRVKGYFSCPEKAFAKAKEICDKLNEKDLTNDKR